MLYELIAVVRTGNITYVKDVARTTGSLILSRTGTIRNLSNWGVFDLPRPTVKYQTQHHKGHYFCMTFDSSASVQAEVRRQLGLNPHMIRFSMVKVGDKLGGARNEKGRMEDVDGQLKWKAVKDEVEVLGERNPYSLI
ncbi:hypothetical protein LTR70_008393 [Exophiala xenobiotica]|uniref:Mitochondrial ribosomal protein S6 n=1 Tax=Lithohypha guttulata TaxID=1690604 RepID=A0ABR0K1B1_9EURO|nr:hypothetical protein LTR24_008005 [Lithohypha guttulata]KAK5312134.1 hypothetical protein LTR70_008393 [Exophiala xenobiotica]